MAAASAPLEVPTKAVGSKPRASSAATAPACDEKQRKPDERMRSREEAAEPSTMQDVSKGAAAASSSTRKYERRERRARQNKGEGDEARVRKQVRTE